MEFVTACVVVALVFEWWADRRYLREIADTWKRSAVDWEERYFQLSRDVREWVEKKEGGSDA